MIERVPGRGRLCRIALTRVRRLAGTESLYDMLMDGKLGLLAPRQPGRSNEQADGRRE